MSDPGIRYLALNLAAKLYGRPLEALGPDESQRVESVAARQREIETLILATPQAAAVMLPAASVDAGLAEIRGRYGSDEAYRAELHRAGLDPAALRQAVRRELVVEAVLEQVAARCAPVTETEAEIFWLMHRERFRRPAARVLRHILVTINEALAGSERRNAHARIDAIRASLLAEPQRFAEQAARHSECPTAMNGGQLGSVRRGRLYPELEAAAFALAETELSAVIESELGFHLIVCDAIEPERQLRFCEAEASIRALLERERRSACQKSWIKALPRRALARVSGMSG